MRSRRVLRVMRVLPERPGRPVRRGFTLIEVLLVLAILGVIAAMVVPNLLGTQREAMINTTKTSIRGLEKTLQLYAIKNNGEFPENLAVLTQSRQVDGRTESPLLDEVPKDAWGTEFFYAYPPRHNQNSNKPDIWSAGPNKQNDQGSGDDVNNWNSN